jgi:hypothetical protein
MSALVSEVRLGGQQQLAGRRAGPDTACLVDASASAGW